MVGIAQPVTKKYLRDETATYEEAISFYTEMAEKNSVATLITYGGTDIGKPLHLFVISGDRDFDPESIRQKNKRIVFINNAIHPGEPCGVDASIKLTYDLLKSKKLKYLLDRVVICIVPIYNIGGALNRGCCSRANQNGPKEYGFRGNAQNLDLNRDFIKCDSKNAMTFTRMFRAWNPDIFIDTHTSNGADYQYVMTLIATQKDKLNSILSEFVEETMLPELYSAMKAVSYEMIPYVNSIDKIPDNGIVDFLETPRYSSGYTTLFNTIGFTTETHMFKPFEDRVLATYHFLLATVKFAGAKYQEIGEKRRLANEHVAEQEVFPIFWELDTTKYKQIEFKGFEAGERPSSITGEQRLFYNREKPYTKNIRYYNTFKATIEVQRPYMYLIPQAWTEVINRLENNNIQMSRLTVDTILEVETYYISGYESLKRPYEGHYLHSKVKLNSVMQSLKFYKGDYAVICDQSSNRYIVECLEPQSKDSYFAWNLFDASLQQKEWFSSYVFEDLAAELLDDNVDLRARFEAKKRMDTVFSTDSRSQLRFIYENSSYYEKSHNRYPVARVLEKINIPLTY
ncbi:MAG: hypothetical protein COB85_06740 [Bacteroidetes bacterium]|nr:MAG: hypothetical protein COB85_06740 [Bacteroidota bacterium]